LKAWTKKAQRAGSLCTTYMCVYVLFYVHASLTNLLTYILCTL